MDIKIIAIGDIKDNNLLELINKYFLRIKKFAKIEIISLKEENYDDLKKTINLETNKIISKLNKYKLYKKIVLNLNSKLIDSLNFSKIIDNNQNYNQARIIFIIGGSNGLNYDLINQHIDYQISFGKITFPHQIFQLILLEQIYRAIKIIRNEKYHK